MYLIWAEYLPDPAVLSRLVEESVIKLLKYINVAVGDDVIESLRRVRDASSGLGAEVMEAVLRNIEVGRAEGRPVCQDTGLVVVKVVIGDGFPLKLSEVRRSVVRGVARATEEVPLRPNAIDLVTGANTGSNVGEKVPWIVIEPTEGDALELSIMVKGGGSEAACRALSAPPIRGFRAAANLVVDVIAEHGFNTCPPLFVGVGLGGTVATAAEIAYEALFRPVGVRHGSREIAEFEEYLLELLNKLGIGPGGLGGGPTVVDVHVETAAHHPASMGVAVAVNCWALRRGKVRIHPDGTAEFFKYSLGGGVWVRW